MSATGPAIVGGVRRVLSQHAATIYGMIGRLWLVMTGPLTIVVLAVYLTPYAQGYFFTFI